MKLDTLYKRNTIGGIQEWTAEVEDDKWRVISGKIDGKKVTSKWKTAKAKNVGKANETTAVEQALKDAQNKHKKQLKERYCLDISNIDDNFYIAPMLAKKFKDYRERFVSDKPRYEEYKYPVIVDVKYNGARCVSSFIQKCKTRKGRDYHNIQHIAAQLEELYKEFPDIVVDGELYNFEKRNLLNQIIELVSISITPETRTEEQAQKSKEIVQYHIYDAFNYVYDGPHFEMYGFELNNGDKITPDTPCFIRRIALTWLVNKRLHRIENNYCYVAEYQIAETESSVDAIVKDYITLGQEGGVIRIMSAPYEFKRSAYLLKHKKWEDAEFKILNIESGEGNWEGCAKRIICELPNGENFASNVRGTQEFCRNVLQEKEKYIGKIITVEFQEYSEYGVPQIPYTSLIVRDYE